MYVRKRIARENWFTYQRPVDEDAKWKAKQLAMGSQLHLNDEHRTLLRDKLNQYPSELTLPSTEFSIHPIFPILNRPTFQAANEKTLVLLAISCIGCLLQHHKEAVKCGRTISEQLNKAVLNSVNTDSSLCAMDELNWVSNVEQKGHRALATMQAAVIGQTYALLSGDPRNLAVLSSFHGTVLAWCKQEKYMSQGTDVPDHGSLDPETSYPVWVPPLPFCWLPPAELWDAPSAEQGKDIASQSLDSYKSSQGPASPTADLALIWGQIARQDDLNLSMQLEHIAVLAIENNRLGSLPQTEGFIEKSLLALFQQHLSSHDRDEFMLRSLWHSTFIVSLTDIHRLELAAGKYNEPSPAVLNESSEAYVRRWAASINAQRAVLHAALLLRELEFVSIRAVTPIHISSSLYHAAMAVYCYLRFSPADRSFIQIGHGEFPEITCLGINSGELMLEIHDFQRSRPLVEASKIMSALIDMLNRIGYWSLSRPLGCLMVFLTTDCRAIRDQS
ncbi:uncharacterized protein N7503_004151 [Penicillium pulvis]|uniref:uncharacterized protein n=1 Tax=Penicillium pulvis TaxID=1562058 RepID=UPI0025478E81|nr:uncharacterized protein N7503_004151 [Penicillium pulvis]KAJ5806549.1 hypothetical protein N7503_004151 [Penicillium pulvis]